MATFANAEQIYNDIKSLAIDAMRRLPPAQPPYQEAKRRSISPVPYMRYAEFDAILRDLEIQPGMTILDVSSPQWFSIYLAKKYPDANFHYINILESELEPHKEIAKTLGIKNLKYQKGDVRNLAFHNNTFDKVISISVIEHIHPEEHGDLNALREIMRVLKPKGNLLLTVPYKAKRNIVYMDGPVYERSAEGRNFFAREYDRGTFGEMVEESGFSLRSSSFICEREGLFPLDYYEWGAGKDYWAVPFLMMLKKLIERIFRRSLDPVLARRYLIISRKPMERLVNIATKFEKP